MTKNEFIAQFDVLSEQDQFLFAKLFSHTSQSLASEKASNKQLVAYLSGSHLEKEKIEGELKKQLPAHMVPRHYVILPSLPKLPNGKVDVLALSKLEIQNIKEVQESKKLSSSAQALKKIWEEVLQIEEIGIHDNFFELGGDSILAIQIVSRARNQGINLSPAIFLQKQTIAEILDTEVHEVGEEAVLENGNTTPIQSWFLQTQGMNAHWHLGVEIDLVKKAEPFLEEALNDVLNSNTVLKSTFSVENSGQTSVNHRAKVIFKEIDILGLEDEERAVQVAIQEIHAQMSLEDGKLVGALHVKSYSSKLYLSAHHLVVDPVSMLLLFEGLATAIGELSTGKKLSPSKSNFKHYFQFSKELSEFPVTEELAFWKSQITGAERLPILSNQKCTEQDLTRSNFFISTELSEKITSLIKQHDWLSSEMLFTTALCQSICSWAKQNQLTIGIEKSLRSLDLSNIQNSMGWMASYFPLKVEVNLNDVCETLINVLEKQDAVVSNGVGFGILRYAQKANDLEIDPQILINFLGASPMFKHEHLGEGKPMKNGLRSLNSAFGYLVEFNISVVGKAFCINHAFASVKIPAADVQQILLETAKCLGELVANGGEKLAKTYQQKGLSNIGLDDSDFDELISQF